MANNVELIIKADTSDAVKNIRKLMDANQEMSDSAKKQIKERLSAIEKEIYDLEELRKARIKAQTKDEVAEYNKLIEQQSAKLNELENAGRKVEKQTETLSEKLIKWVGSLGLATVALNKLKDAFMQTALGIDLFNIAGAAMNQVLGNIVSGVSQWNRGVGEAISLAKQENEIRKQNYIENLRAKKLMQEYNKLYTEGIDNTITSEEKVKKLTAAKNKFTEAINMEIASTRQQLDIAERQWKLNPENEKRQEKYFGLLGRVLDLQGEIESGTRRLIAQITAEEERARKELIEWRKKLHSDLNSLLVSYLEEQERIRQEAIQQEVKEEVEGHAKYQQQRIKAEKEGLNKKNKEIKTGEEILNKWLKGIREQTAESEKIIGDGLVEQNKKNEEQKVKDVEDAEEKKRRLRQQTWDTIINAEQAIFQILSNNVENNLQKELQALDKRTQASIKAAGDDARKVLAIENKAKQESLEIEKRYKKDQQRLAIAETIINGAVAIVKLFKDYTFVVAGPLALAMAALTALQVGVIKSQKFAKGGWTGQGGMRDDTGERIAGIVHEEEFVTRRGPAKKYREVLEAINKDDQRLMVNRFTKLMPETVIAPVNNVSVENTGPNTRLDRINNQLNNLNRILQPKKQVAQETAVIDNATIIRRGTNVRTVKR